MFSKHRHFIPRDVRIVPLKNMGKNILVYMYRPERLRKDLSDNAAGAKCIGVWKVYGNVETAQRKFAQYRK